MKGSMAVLKFKRFSKPQVLKQIGRELLERFFAEFHSGADQPSPAGTGISDCEFWECVDRMFVAPNCLSGEMNEALFVVDEMASPLGMDAILHGARENGLNPEADDEATPAEVAMRAWLLDRSLLENLHNCHQLTRPRAFQYFSTDADPLPEFSAPTLDQIGGLEDRLNGFYEAWKRGRGARVFAYSQQGEWWFLVRHGMPCRREGAMKDGKPTTVFYRPQRHDVVVYDPSRGEIRMNCCGKRERAVFLRAFGSHLFGNKDFFPGTEKYTLGR